MSVICGLRVLLSVGRGALVLLSVSCEGSVAVLVFECNCWSEMWLG